MQKRGISQVITTVFLVMITFVAVGVLFGLIKPFISEKTHEIGRGYEDIIRGALGEEADEIIENAPSQTTGEIVPQTTETEGNLVAHYKFENNFDDSSGNNNHGIPFGYPKFVNGKSNLGRAIRFDGVGDYVRIDNPVLGSEEMTICAWAKKQGDGNFQTIASDYASDRANWMLGYNNPLNKNIPDSFSFFAGDGQNARIVKVDMGFTKYTWHHVCGVFDGSSERLDLYIDNVRTPGNTDIQNLGTEEYKTFIGQYQGNFFNGSIDELKIWNYALSDYEIRQEYRFRRSHWCFGADIDQDGLVSGPDLDIVLADWGRHPCTVDNSWCNGADIHQDGAVTGSDMDSVLGSWGINSCSRRQIVLGEVIFEDTEAMVTPSTWNPYLPKFVSNGDWTYAVYTRYTPSEDGRISWIFKKHRDDDFWSGKLRTINYLHQPPGLSLDNSGKLHFAFDCFREKNCDDFGVGAGEWERFYNLIFYQFNPDGSINLNDEDQNFKNYNEFVNKSHGYMTIGTNPQTGKTYVSLAYDKSNEDINNTFQQKLFETKQNETYWEVPKITEDHTVRSLYPLIAFSPNGDMYYVIRELIQNWSNSAQNNHTAVYKVNVSNGEFKKIFSDSVENPNGTTEAIQHSDIDFNSANDSYFLYYKQPPEEGAVNYLVKNDQNGEEIYIKPLPEWWNSYTKLQIDSEDNLYLLQTQGKDLELGISCDDGESWTKQLIELDYLPEETTVITAPGLIKPGNSPNGYDRDRIYGAFSGGKLVTKPDGNKTNMYWYMATIDIDLVQVREIACQ